MINISSLSLARGSHQIYQDFNAHLEKGEAVLLTGPNGTGKSTLIALIGGLLTSLLGAPALIVLLRLRRASWIQHD